MKKPVWFVLGCVLILSLLSSGGIAGAQEPDPPSTPPPRPPLPLDGVLDPALFELAPGAAPPPAETEERASAAMGDPAQWSRIAFQSLRDGNWEIYIADGEDKNQARLTRGSASDIYPRLNRGCTRIVFASDRDGQYELYSMRPDGTGLARLTNSLKDDVSPAWSPDGARIAFQSERDGQPEIYVMNADGSGQTRLTFDGELDLSPVWSPDGETIAFVSRRTGGYRIWAMNADGSGQRQLSNQPYSENPAWSPDGATIAYDANANGDLWQDLWLMDADGSNQRQVFAPGGNQDVWVRSWAPYGGAVAFTRAQWYEHKGRWYLDSIQLSLWAPSGGGDFQMSGNRDMHPDWQTLDVQPPQVALDPLPAYVRADQEVRLLWSGDDAGGSGLKSYDVQYQDLASTAWVDLKMDTEEQFASFTGTPGHRYRCRVRARDSAFNVSRWTAPDGADTVAFYTWAVSGTARDARGAPLRGVQVQTAPPAFEAPPSDAAGAYKAYVAGAAGAYGVAWSKPGYVALPTTNLDGAQDAEFVDVVLPAGDNLLFNWDFERGVLDGADWVPGGVVSPALAAGNLHTGRFAARLGRPSQAGTDLAAGMQYGYLAQPATDDQGTVHVVLIGRRADRAELFYRQLPKGGVWTTPANVPGQALNAHNADLAVGADGRVHVAWSNDVSGQGPDILYAVRERAGAWSTPVNVSRSTSGSDEPQIAVGKDGVVHVVWKQEKTNAHEVYYARKGGAGGWSGAVKLSDNTQHVEDLELVADGSGAVHVAWVCDGLFYVRRDAAGNWSAPLSLAASSWYMEVQLGVDDSNALHVAWNRQGSLWYTRRSAAGAWSAQAQVGSSSDARAPSLVVTGGGEVHAAWQSLEPGDNWEVFYARQAAGGGWSQPKNVTDDPRGSTDPRLALDRAGALHLLWQDATRREVYYAWRGTDGVWAAGRSLAPSDSGGGGLYLIVGGQADVHAFWYAYVGGHTAIFHASPPRVAQVGDSTLSQAVEIPAAMTYPTLSLWYDYESSAPASAHWFGVEVDDGNQIHQLFAEAENGYRWQHRWFDMSPWSGRTVTITLRVHQSPGDPRAWATVDEVSLASVSPDLWVEKAGRQTAALPGQTVVYDLVYGNRGRVAALGARLTDTLPPELVYVAADPAPATIGAALAWELGDPAAESGPYTIVLTATVAADAARGESTPNRASITCATAELDTTNNVAPAPLWVGGRLFLPLTIKE